MYNNNKIDNKSNIHSILSQEFLGFYFFKQLISFYNLVFGTNYFSENLCLCILNMYSLKIRNKYAYEGCLFSVLFGN